MPVTPIPEGYHTVTPYLMMRRASEAIEFYRKAFGAELLMKMDAPGGKIGHAELQVGDSRIMLADEHPDQGYVGPESLGGAGVSLLMYVDDVDTSFARAIEAGATELRPVEDQFYGDRMGTLRDPFGHVWSIATHVEDLSPEEMDRRMQEQHGG